MKKKLRSYGKTLDPETKIKMKKKVDAWADEILYP